MTSTDYYLVQPLNYYDAYQPEGLTVPNSAFEASHQELLQLFELEELSEPSPSTQIKLEPIKEEPVEKAEIRAQTDAKIIRKSTYFTWTPEYDQILIDAMFQRKNFNRVLDKFPNGTTVNMLRNHWSKHLKQHHPTARMKIRWNSDYLAILERSLRNHEPVKDILKKFPPHTTPISLKNQWVKRLRASNPGIKPSWIIR